MTSVESVLLRSIMDISSIVILALQIYSPPWDVSRGLNVRVMVVVVPDVS